MKKRVSFLGAVMISSLFLITALSNITYAADAEFCLNDTPGNWFTSEGQTILPAANGTPLAIIDPGQIVEFERKSPLYSDTIHTATMLIKPSGSTLPLFSGPSVGPEYPEGTDQAVPGDGGVHVTFDAPGVYLWICKVHPYMTGVVAVRNAGAADDAPLDIPDVTSTDLPFIGHLTDALGLPGDPPLPAVTVLSVITTIAPLDNDNPLFGKLGPTPFFPAGHPLEGANGAFGPKWDILKEGDPLLKKPHRKGVGEIWVDTQFERVPGQINPDAEPAFQQKPGTITVVNATNWKVKQEINGLGAEDHMWNNPHNMWANTALDTVYNGNWFGKWINKIDRKTGKILHSIAVGEAPTHIVTIPPALGTDAGQLVIPLSAGNDIVKLTDSGCCLSPAGSFPSGDLSGIDGTHPHGHWLNCGPGDRITAPNVFNGLGPQGKISILATSSGDIRAEFGAGNGVVMPLAAGECHVDDDSNPLTPDVNKAYVSDVVTGEVHVIDVGSEGGSAPSFITHIPVTLTPDGLTGH
ncbi:MAG: hypothetical protein ACUZ77_01725, partial [Candidatus Brocadiales bacterium]